MVFSFLDSPVGKLVLVCDEQYVYALIYKNNWPTFKSNFPLAKKGANDLTLKAERQLSEYFSGKRKTFSLPLKSNGTFFQESAWQVLAEIPYGKTISYEFQAQKMKNSKAVRAVGSANGKNPLSILIPCHRVTGKNGSLRGYAGGVNQKKYLLELEGVIPRSDLG